MLSCAESHTNTKLRETHLLMSSFHFPFMRSHVDIPFSMDPLYANKAFDISVLIKIVERQIWTFCEILGVGRQYYCMSGSYSQKRLIN